MVWEPTYNPIYRYVSQYYYDDNNDFDYQIEPQWDEIVTFADKCCLSKKKPPHLGWASIDRKVAKYDKNLVDGTESVLRSLVANQLFILKIFVRNLIAPFVELRKSFKMITMF